MVRWWDDMRLEDSSLVANNAMNRERGLRGVNSYQRELGFDPLAWLSELARSEPGREVVWLDLCCGRGRALAEAASLVDPELKGRIRFVGVDLVELFDAASGVEVVCASVARWVPEGRFDLITCVHGLHYVGDKLGVLARAAGWLSDAGRLQVDLELAAIRSRDSQPLTRRAAGALRAAGFDVDVRRHRVALHGRREVTLPFVYLGADPHAGPNYTGQPAVHSYYDPAG